MAKENEADIEIPEDESFEGIEDAVELKAKLDEVQRKHREAGIRNRERTKALKERLASAEAKPTSQATSEEKGNKTDEESRLLQKVERMTLRAAGITDADEVELARTTAKKWGMDLDEVIDDEDFKAKLDKIRTAKANADATSNIRAGAGSSGAKNTLEYWTQWAKDNPGQVPQITDKKLLTQFMRSMMQNASTGGKKFYND